MFRALTVVPSGAAPAPLPTADVVVRIAEDGAVRFTGPLVAGRRVVRVENAGARDYEFQLRGVRPGHTAAAAMAAAAPRGLARAGALRPGRRAVGRAGQRVGDDDADAPGGRLLRRRRDPRPVPGRIGPALTDRSGQAPTAPSPRGG